MAATFLAFGLPGTFDTFDALTLLCYYYYYLITLLLLLLLIIPYMQPYCPPLCSTTSLNTTASSARPCPSTTPTSTNILNTQTV